MYRWLLVIFLACLGIFTETQSAQNGQPWQQQLAKAAEERTTHKVIYNGAYRQLGYPGGDVPNNIGVCTDVIVRSYRKLGIDLQQLVHEDMQSHFKLYPNLWGLKKPDSNIDHRRVPNLQVFFQRFGTNLPVTNMPQDYMTGDIVTWRLSNNLPHIGIVGKQRSKDGERYLIIHNIGLGPKQDDFLFKAKITGHYRFYKSE
ncbi:DUF1287 domain-containing protein [Aliikangiella sp. IMCC44359]|uniref:DUF1287 domain-containing protein n=1 Tax=Aliikangiella sp. IMCC44359 TaxID=3459125 RepID=UPI00403B1D98